MSPKLYFSTIHAGFNYENQALGSIGKTELKKLSTTQ